MKAVSRIARNTMYFLVGVGIAALLMLPVARFQSHTEGFPHTETVYQLIDSDGSRCSAVMIAPERAVTAKHCIRAMESPSLKIGEKLYPAIEAYTNEFVDAGILIVPDAPCPCATFRSTKLVKGETIVVIGYPFDSDEITELEGIITGDIIPFNEMPYTITTAAPTVGGMSGGGVFDENGLLLGVHAIGVMYGLFSGFADMTGTPLPPLN